jgi:hypothetical protein
MVDEIVGTCRTGWSKANVTVKGNVNIDVKGKAQVAKLYGANGFGIDGKITVNADEYEVSGIKNFYISEEDDPTDIKGADAEGKFTYGANTLVVKAGESAVVKVYGVSGAEVEAEIVKAGGAVSVNLNNLERGVYVVKVGKASFKVIKK